MLKEIVLDCRELEAPEPLHLITTNLYKINKEHYIKMLHRMEPQMLLSILHSNGYDYIIKHINNEVNIYIYEKNNITQKEYIESL